MYTKITVARGSASSNTESVAVALFADTTKLPKALTALDKELGGVIAAQVARPEAKLGLGAVTTLYAGKGGTRVYLLGLGNGKRPMDAVRIAGAKLTGAASAAGVKRVALYFTAAFSEKFSGEFDAQAIGRGIGEGVAIGSFTFDQFKGIVSKPSKSGKGKSNATALTLDVEVELRKEVDRGLTVGLAANTARDLAATPPNVANPGFLVKTCRKLAAQTSLKCTVLDKAKLTKLKLNGLLAVGAAGSTPPALIALEHKPSVRGGSKNKLKNAKTPRNTPTVLLVGKAITFDTGGYSLKSGAGMTGMKYDKCGGMAVIGAMKAIAALNVDVHVVGLISAAENMVDQGAYRPDDILTMYNGVTVEVTNTDAEGRLVLADALAYGCKTYKPSAVINLATLTGGVVVALGSAMAGAFVNDADLRQKLFDAGDAVGERLWHLPLWDEHRDMMKGSQSDIINSAPKREAHPIQGAAFLDYFVAKDGDFKKKEHIPWAHLDIAAVADMDGGNPLYPKGPTGFGVRLLVKALESWGK